MTVSEPSTADGDLTPPASLLDSPTSWTVAAATFLSTFTVFGVAYSFGAFFGPMADEFGTERSATSFFFAVTTFLYFILGAVTGRIADRRGPRPVLIVGAVCMVVGLLITSRVQSIWLGYLTYGLGVGIGVACAYVPMVAAVGAWFERKRTTALGVAVAGIGVGTLAVVPLAEWSIETNGWRDTYVLMAVLSAVLLSLAALGARRPVQVQQAETDMELGHLMRTSRPFWVLYVSAGLISMALFVPFVYLPDYVDTEGIEGSAGWLVGLIGISSVVGRLGLGALAGRLPVMHLYKGSFLVLGLSFLIWLAAGTSYALLVVFALVLGVAYGGFIALAPAVTADLFGAAGLGTLLGFIYTAAGVGGLIGPPLMGLIIDEAGYDTTLVVAMLFGLAAFAVLTTVARPSARDRLQAG